jgi:tRNA pseudouridine55 synthase
MAVIRPTVLNINKPIGWTSRDVLNKLQSIYKFNKFGHAGTLDPLASGVLLVLVGEECKKQEYYMSQSKSYSTRIIFDVFSDTNDLEGPITATCGELTVKSDKFKIKIKEHLNSLIGRFEQQVPYFSAVKINGKELYKSAREGNLIDTLPVKQVELKKFTINNFNFTGSSKTTVPQEHLKKLDMFSDNIETLYKKRLDFYSSNFSYVDLTLDVSKGFYVRSLARDIGKHLGTNALMASLVRSKVGTFNVKDSKDLDYFLQAPDLL